MDYVREYDTHLDAKRRLTLRGVQFDYYHVSELKNGTIILEPRVLASPFEISGKTLEMMDISAENLKKGIVSEEVDLSEFGDSDV